MLTRKLINTKAGLIYGLAIGLLSQAVTATEVVVVNGNDVAKMAEATQAQFESEMRLYIEAFNRDLEANLKRSIESMEAPRLELALAEAPARG